MHRDPHADDEPPVGCSFSELRWLDLQVKSKSQQPQSAVKGGIRTNALSLLTKSTSDRTGRSVSNHSHSERARDMSALLHLFKLLSDRDRIAAACVCKVAEERLGCCWRTLTRDTVADLSFALLRSGTGCQNTLLYGLPWTCTTANMLAKRCPSCLTNTKDH